MTLLIADYFSIFKITSTNILSNFFPMEAEVNNFKVVQMFSAKSDVLLGNKFFSRLIRMLWCISA